MVVILSGSYCFVHIMIIIIISIVIIRMYSYRIAVCTQNAQIVNKRDRSIDRTGRKRGKLACVRVCYYYI